MNDAQMHRDTYKSLDSFFGQGAKIICMQSREKKSYTQPLCAAAALWVLFFIAVPFLQDEAEMFDRVCNNERKKNLSGRT